MTKQTFSLPEKLHMAMKLLCVKEKISITNYIVRLIKDDLTRRGVEHEQH